MTLIHLIDRSPDELFKLLATPEGFTSVHPIIYKMEEIEKGKYQVYEKLKVLFIPFTITYTTTIEPDFQKKEIIMDALVKKKTKIKIHFKITSEENETKVEEIVQFSSPLPIKGMFLRLLKKQHVKMFENIRNFNFTSTL